MVSLDNFQRPRVPLPDPDWFVRHRAKLAGFAAGVLGPVLLALFVTVSLRGYGLGDDPPVPPQVYSNF